MAALAASRCPRCQGAKAEIRWVNGGYSPAPFRCLPKRIKREAYLAILCGRCGKQWASLEDLERECKHAHFNPSSV